MSTSTRSTSAPPSATLLLELRAGLAAAEVDQRLCLANRGSDLGARTIAFYFADMAERGVHQELGYSTALHYAQARLSMAAPTAREHLAVGKALADLPALEAAFRAERLGWSQLRALARIATPETEAEWADWAQHRTVAQVEAHARQREKGQRPSDPARRRIHQTKVAVVAKLDLIERELWNNALAKLQAETGAPASDHELAMRLVKLYLDLRPDGSVPGFTRVNESHFRVVVTHDAVSGATTLHTSEGDLPLEGESARAVLEAAGRGELAPKRSEENAGREVPGNERDKPTPPDLRERVLERDGCRCRVCASKQNLTVHHVHWRRFGGRTVADNLVVLCEQCHSLVHDRLLVIEGTVTAGLRFQDRAGRPLDAQPAATGLALALGDARASAPRPVRFADLPATVDAAWWQSHAHLFQGRGSELVFEPGVPQTWPQPCPEHANPPGSSEASRPQTLADIIGQGRAVANLSLAVSAAQARGTALPHVLLSGPPGVGKTSLARAVAHELGSCFHSVHAPVVAGGLRDEPAALLRLLTGLGPRDVLFLDEVHRLPVRVAEALYQAMEDRRISLLVHCEGKERVLQVELPAFTLIAATTEEDQIPLPMRQRFGLRERLEFCAPGDLETLLLTEAERHGLVLDARAATLLAAAARETPREALVLLHAAADGATLARVGETAPRIDPDLALQTLARLGIDDVGLRPFDREYLRILRSAGRPLGVGTLAARLGVSRSTLQCVHEPFLLRKGLIRMTPLGRAAG